MSSLDFSDMRLISNCAGLCASNTVFHLFYILKDFRNAIFNETCLLKSYVSYPNLKQNYYNRIFKKMKILFFLLNRNYVETNYLKYNTTKFISKDSPGYIECTSTNNFFKEIYSQLVIEIIELYILNTSPNETELMIINITKERFNGMNCSNEANVQVIIKIFFNIFEDIMSNLFCYNLEQKNYIYNKNNNIILNIGIPIITSFRNINKYIAFNGRIFDNHDIVPNLIIQKNKVDIIYNLIAVLVYTRIHSYLLVVHELKSANDTTFYEINEYPSVKIFGPRIKSSNEKINFNFYEIKDLNNLDTPIKSYNTRNQILNLALLSQKINKKENISTCGIDIDLNNTNYEIFKKEIKYKIDNKSI